MSKTENRAAAQAVGDRIEVRVLPQGEGRVFTGESDRVTGAATTYGRGEIFTVAYDIARALEARGLVEIQA